MLDVTGMANGKLMATRLALWEAIGRLDDDACTELQSRFVEMLDEISTVWSAPFAGQQTEIIDELELTAHQMRYHPAHTDTHGPQSGDYAVVCIKCDTFPIGSWPAVPNLRHQAVPQRAQDLGEVCARASPVPRTLHRD